MDGPKYYHTKRSKSDKNKCQIPYDIIYMWNLEKRGTKWTYLQNRNRLTDIKTLMVTKQESGRMDKLGGWDEHID